MKTILKMTLTVFVMSILLTSCGTAYHCTEGPEEVPSETTFKEETPIQDVKKNWTPAAERGTVSISEETDLTSNTSEELADDSKTEKTDILLGKDRETQGKFRNKKRSKVKEIINTVKKAKNNRDGGAMLVLLIILAIILPPLAVGIYEGITGRFWLVLILWLIGWVLFGWLYAGLGGIIGLAALAAIILALLIVLEFGKTLGITKYKKGHRA